MTYSFADCLRVSCTVNRYAESRIFCLLRVCNGSQRQSGILILSYRVQIIY